MIKSKGIVILCSRGLTNILLLALLGLMAYLIAVPMSVTESGVVISHVLNGEYNAIPVKVINQVSTY